MWPRVGTFDERSCWNRFDFSIYDLDERNEHQGEAIKETLIIDIHPVASHVLSPATKIITFGCKGASDPNEEPDIPKKQIPI